MAVGRITVLGGSESRDFDLSRFGDGNGGCVLELAGVFLRCGVGSSRDLERSRVLLGGVSSLDFDRSRGSRISSSRDLDLSFVTLLGGGAKGLGCAGLGGGGLKRIGL
jgi:hypothetical protein